MTGAVDDMPMHVRCRMGTGSMQLARKLRRVSATEWTSWAKATVIGVGLSAAATETAPERLSIEEIVCAQVSANDCLFLRGFWPCALASKQ